MDDAELSRLRDAGALAETRRTPPPAVGSPAARRTPSLPAFSAPDAASQPSRAPRETRVSPAPTPVASNVELVLSSGERLLVAGRGVIGRDPSEAQGAYSHRLALADTDKLLSRAHLEFGLESNGQFWISDLHSTNGVVVETPGQSAQRCLPGYRVVIRPGERVTFGGRILTIERR